MIDLKVATICLPCRTKLPANLISELHLTLSPTEAERLKPDAEVNPVAYEFFFRDSDFHGQHKYLLAISRCLEKVH